MDEEKQYTEEEIQEFMKEFEEKNKDKFDGHAQPGEVHVIPIFTIFLSMFRTNISLFFYNQVPIDPSAAPPKPADHLNPEEHAPEVHKMEVSFLCLPINLI